MYGNSGYLACCVKPALKPLVDEPSNGNLEIRGQAVRKASISEDIWTPSTCDMENSQVRSQGSISSISTSNQTLDQLGSSGSANSPSEFVNHGLILWNQMRQCWVGNKKSESRPPRKVQEPILNLNATYESLLASNKPFPRPIPLAEMVDFLVDIWEQEGLYD